MSRVPIGSDRPVGGVPDRSSISDGGNEQLRKRFQQVPQGVSADIIAALDGIAREEIDAFALASQGKAAAAIVEGRFARSLVRILEPSTGALLLAREEFPRPTTADGLAALPASFAALGQTLDAIALTQLCRTARRGALDENARITEAAQTMRAVTHVHTAGNSSGIADGAAAILVTSADYAKANGLRARARIRATVTTGSDPILMLTGPTPASKKALSAAGMTVGDIDLWEINEAFGVVPSRRFAISTSTGIE